MMNPFVHLWSKKRILRNGRLSRCLVLLILVFIPLTVALVFSQSMMNGIRDKFIYLSDGHIQSYEDSLDNNVVFSCDKVISGNAILYSKDKTCQIRIKGVPEGYFNEKRKAQVKINGSTPDSSISGILLSEKTAEKLNVKTNDKIALIIVPSDSSVKIRPMLIQVTGTYSSGYNQLDMNIAFASFNWASKAFDSLPYNEIILNNPYSDYAFDTAYELGLKNFSTWDMNNTAVYSNFVASSQLIMLIMLLVVAIAAFYTSMVANQIIFEDIKEIEISKVLGTTDSHIKQSAFISVFSITVSAMIIGTALGIGVSYLIVPAMDALGNIGLELFSYYLLSFEISIPFGRITVLILSMAILSAFSVLLSIRKIKHITALQLFTKQ